MLPRRMVQLPTIDGMQVSNANAVGTIRIKPGQRLSKVVLKYVDGQATPTTDMVGANSLTGVIGDITCFKNGSDFRLHSAVELDYLNSQNNIPGSSEYSYQNVGSGATKAQYLTINFFEPWRATPADREAGALVIDPSQGWNADGLEIQIKLLAALPATASLTAIAYVDSFIPNTNAAQAVKVVKRLNITASGTVVDYLSLPAIGGLQGINLKNPATSGTISSVIFKAANKTWIDDIPTYDSIAHLTSMGLTAPSSFAGAGAFAYSIVFDDTDPIQAALQVDGANPWLRIKSASAMSGNIVALIEAIQAI
jgi:hypothetical protein